MRPGNERQNGTKPRIAPSANQDKILRYLFEHPTATQWQIAEATGLTESSVKHLIDDMRQRRWITSGYNVNLRSLGYDFRYRVDIWVAPKKLRENAGGLPGDFGVTTQSLLAQYIMEKLPAKERFAQNILVEDVRILLGSPADLSATVRAKSIEAMLEFVTEGLRMCGAIYQTSSFQEALSSRYDDDEL